jgi:lipopolysaccharide/colanic/teichoic acid biosynthesis glycosyltransferase
MSMRCILCSDAGVKLMLSYSTAAVLAIIWLVIRSLFWEEFQDWPRKRAIKLLKDEPETLQEVLNIFENETTLSCYRYLFENVRAERGVERQYEWRDGSARILAVLVTLVALPVLVPVLAFVALAIRLDSPGPVFFVQKRAGLGKRPFNMIKFRSMVTAVDHKPINIALLNETEGPGFELKIDPRVTWVGRYLRHTCIDELPQLINILRGDMNLVGPRPLSMRAAELFVEDEKCDRFSVKPGLTCLWQTSGEAVISFDRSVELDFDYIENRSLWLDLKILLSTVKVVLTQQISRRDK